MGSEHKARPGKKKKKKKKGETCGLMLWSERLFFACEFVFPVRLSENCYIF